MMTRRMTIFGCAVALLSLGLTASSVSAGNSGEPLAVVVAKNSSVNDLTLFQLKRLYMGDSLDDPSGNKMLALNRGSQTAERIGFDKTVLGMTPEEAARYWIDRRIRGQSAAPKAVDPGSVVQKVVSKLKGSISYVRLREVSSEVKVVTVDGRKPGDSGYPIVAAPAGATSGAASSRRWF